MDTSDAQLRCINLCGIVWERAGALVRVSACFLLPEGTLFMFSNNPQCWTKPWNRHSFKMDETEAQTLPDTKSYDSVQPGLILDSSRKFKSQPWITNADAYMHQRWITLLETEPHITVDTQPHVNFILHKICLKHRKGNPTVSHDILINLTPYG